MNRIICAALLSTLFLFGSVAYAHDLNANCSFTPTIKYGDFYLQVMTTASVRVAHSEYAKSVNIQVRDEHGSIMFGGAVTINAYPGEIGSGSDYKILEPFYPENATEDQKKIILDNFSSEYIGRLSKASCEALAFSR